MTDRWSAWITGTAACLTVAVLAWIAADLIRGVGVVRWQFFVHGPEDFGRGGGVAPMIVASLWLVLISWAVVIPLGILAATALVVGRLHQWPGLRWVEWALDLLAATPSVVIGLFGNAFFCVALGLGFSLLAGGLTLGCMTLPLFVRTTQIGLQAAVTQHYATASALGLALPTTLLRIVLPAAGPAMSAALILATGRSLAETAALIFTSGYVPRMPLSAFDSGRSLSVHVYDLAMNVSGGDQAARGTALVLVVLLLAINAASRLLLGQHGIGILHSVNVGRSNTRA
ncbi:MAG: phosphate ABC transporter, permease protein PstA [Pirellulaceae bacterium]|nr:MAG: phosphate ABC transporter, permease protein PstA [Pirellulaceae bacterium]